MKMGSQRPTATFHLNLTVPEEENFGQRDSEFNDSKRLSQQSWKLNLLKLVKQAPQPIPVHCSEPRRFPHLGHNDNRISESSWASATTCFTDIAEADTDPAFSFKALKLNEEKGVNGLNNGRPKESSVFQTESFDSSSLPHPKNNTKNAEWTGPQRETHRKDENAVVTCVNKGKRILPNKDEEDEDKSENLTISRSTLNSNITGITGEKHQHFITTEQNHRVEKMGKEKGDGEIKRRNVSLSIQGDSDYWEKFRYSKDYQSSLMIETICNEVFNLKPSPRYQNLMKLSQRNKGKVKKKEKESGTTRTEVEASTTESPPLLPKPSQLLPVQCSEDDKGINVEISDRKKEKTKDNRKSIPVWHSHHRNKEFDDERIRDGRALGNKRWASSFPDPKQKQLHHHHEYSTEKESIATDHSNNNGGDDGGGNGNKMEKHEVEHQHYEGERKQSYISTTSSVFTVTTQATSGEEVDVDDENDDENYKEFRRINERIERMLICEGFGSLFHGYLTKEETEKLLENEGQYLIRQVWKEDGFILSFRFSGDVLNYRVICEPDIIATISPRESRHGGGGTFTYQQKSVQIAKCRYYLENRLKGYSTLEELVGEGLLTLHLEENAGSYVDLLVELAQFQRNDNLLLQTPTTSGTPGSRKPSRSASMRRTTIASSSSDDKGSSSTRNSLVIALLVHYFEEEIFNGSAKCQNCLQKISGPSTKGLQCRDCGLVVHESCIDNIKNECKPDLTGILPFSTDLTTLVKGNCTTGGGGGGGVDGTSINIHYGPPYILEKCINELKIRGIGTEGIYRVSGSVEEIENLKNLFERDKMETDLSKCQDIHAITSLLKFFFRELPDPLITKEAFEEYMNKRTGETMTVEQVQTLILCLPPAHKITLKCLLEHLNHVVREKATNKMNAFNLASVLLPSILCPTNIFDVLESGTNLLSFLITYTDHFNY